MAKDDSSSSFYRYLTTGVVDRDFIDQFNTLVSRVYKKYKCPISLDQYQDFCWDKLLERAKNYDPLKGNAGNFIYSLLYYESSRLVSKYSREVGTEIQDQLNPSESYVGTKDFDISTKKDREVRYSLLEFAQLAYSRGFCVDQKQLYFSYYSNNEHPLLKTFNWFRYKGIRHVIREEL